MDLNELREKHCEAIKIVRQPKQPFPPIVLPTYYYFIVPEWVSIQQTPKIFTDIGFVKLFTPHVYFLKDGSYWGDEVPSFNDVVGGCKWKIWS